MTREPPRVHADSVPDLCRSHTQLRGCHTLLDSKRHTKLQTSQRLRFACSSELYGHLACCALAHLCSATILIQHQLLLITPDCGAVEPGGISSSQPYPDAANPDHNPNHDADHDIKNPARLRLVLDTALVSPLRSPVDVTLVVTYSVSRLYMLDGLCLSWGGPVSAAVYQAC